MAVFIAAVTTALVVSFLCSIFESVLLSLGHAQVQMLEKQGGRAGRILSRFKREMEVPIAAILILNTIAHTVGAGQAGASFGAAFKTTPMWVFHVTFTISVLLFTEIVPKTLGISQARRLAVPVAYAVHGLTVALAPILKLTSWISRRLAPRTEQPITSIEEIRMLATAGRLEGALRPRTAGIIEGAANLRDLKVGDVMVPRNRVVSVQRGWDPDQVLEVIRQSGHSRFPVTKGGELDQIEGIVLAKELLLALHRDGSVEWSTLVREPFFVPETKNLHEMLRSFQDNQRHLAVVVDEYGGVDGVVTLEDVLEELVGEIVDESDREAAMLTELPDGRMSSRGAAEIRKVVELLAPDVELETESATVSGFLAEALDRVPQVGDEVTQYGLVFRVTRAGKRRADWVEIRRAVEDADGEQSTED